MLILLIQTLFALRGRIKQKVNLPPNPIFRDIFTADPSAHVWADGRLYVYPSHDLAPPRGASTMDQYHVFSTDDMFNWIDHGVILSSKDVEWGRPEGGFMWAPDCAYRNGHYYYYFPHPSPGNWNDEWKVGVAISDSPTSGFKPLPTPMEKIGGFAMIDPQVFEDDDGKFYFYYGGGSRNDACKGAELNDDMISIKGELQTMEGLVDFHEGTWVFKRNGIYYLTYPDNHDQGGNQMRYAIGKNPLGPWTYQGIFFGPCDAGTSHGSIIEYKGVWYLFYHNKALSGMGELRSVCVTVLEFNEDGSIVYQEPDKSPAVHPEDAPSGGVQYLVENYCEIGGTAVFETFGDNKVLAGLHLDGSYGTFSKIDGGWAGGIKKLYIRFSSEDSGIFIKVQVNGVDADTIFAHGNGVWGDFTAYAHTSVNLNKGDNEIVLNGGSGGINILSIILLD